MLFLPYQFGIPGNVITTFIEVPLLRRNLGSLRHGAGAVTAQRNLRTTQ
jgi:hypothetical protein